MISSRTLKIKAAYCKKVSLIWRLFQYWKQETRIKKNKSQIGPDLDVKSAK